MYRMKALFSLFIFLGVAEAFVFSTLEGSPPPCPSLKISARAWICSPRSNLSSTQSDDINENSSEESSISAETDNPEREKTALELLELQSKSFTSEPIPTQRMDPLLASLTRLDSLQSNAPKVEVPILGEISLDGSLVVVVPTVVIAILGFLMSINIAIQSKDEMVEKLTEVNTMLSATPMARSTVVDSNVCRGLCNNQEEQLESLRKYMKGITGHAPE